MKPLSPRSRLKGDPFLPNRFIFGDAIDQHGIEEYEYLVHTEQPTFVCRLMHRAIPFDGADSEQFASAMLFDPEENVSYYTCNDGLAMTDFVFLGEPDSEPNAGALQKICDEAVAAYWAIDEAYKNNQLELNEYGRRPRELPPMQLDDATRAHAVAELARAARAGRARLVRLSVEHKGELGRLVGDLRRGATEVSSASGRVAGSASMQAATQAWPSASPASPQGTARGVCTTSPAASSPARVTSSRRSTVAARYAGGVSSSSAPASGISGATDCSAGDGVGVGVGRGCESSEPHPAIIATSTPAAGTSTRRDIRRSRQPRSSCGRDISASRSASTVSTPPSALPVFRSLGSTNQRALSALLRRVKSI